MAEAATETRLYYGRVCGAGLTSGERPFVVYAVTGRSPTSQNRKAVVKGELIRIEALGELTPMQREIYEYNAIRPHADGFVVCSNGVHTDYILDEIEKNTHSSNWPQYLREGLNHFGSEPDALRTPRIGIIADPDGFCSGIVQSGQLAESQYYIHNKEKLGIVGTIRTYEGAFADPKVPQRPRNLRFTLDGLTPEDLAGQLFEEMEKTGKGLTVATASAVWDEGLRGWQLAVKNKHGD